MHKVISLFLLHISYRNNWKQQQNRVQLTPHPLRHRETCVENKVDEVMKRSHFSRLRVIIPRFVAQASRFSFSKKKQVVVQLPHQQLVVISLHKAKAGYVLFRHILSFHSRKISEKTFPPEYQLRIEERISTTRDREFENKRRSIKRLFRFIPIHHRPFVSHVTFQASKRIEFPFI